MENLLNDLTSEDIASLNEKEISDLCKYTEMLVDRGSLSKEEVSSLIETIGKSIEILKKELEKGE